MLVMRPLHSDHAANAKDMAASQTHGLIRNTEAYRTQIVVQLRNYLDNFPGHFGADCFSYCLGHNPIRLKERGKRVPRTQRCTLVKLWSEVSGWSIYQKE
jgi:hypothetical protein